MNEFKYERVLLKLSGEALQGEGVYGIDPKVVDMIAESVKEIVDGGVQLAIVVGGGNILHAIYVMASYTYGPLLGLFAFALWGKRRVETRAVWAVCLAAPLLCALLDGVSPLYWHYRFGYELLLLNGLLTFLGLASLSRGGGRSHARRLPASSRRSQ